MAGTQLEVAERVATLVLDRPRALNAIDESVLAGIADAVRVVHRDRSIRALVIRGEGDHFCVGLDLGLLERAFADLDYFRDVLERYRAVLLDLEALDVPVVAAVNGTTRAGGFELALACDLVVVASDARIGDVHTSFGVIPGGGSTQRAPRKLGDQRARELILTARWLTGDEAVAYGIALRAVPRRELDAAVAALVAQLTDKSRDCLGTVKAVMREGAALPLEQGVSLEIEAFVEYLRTSPDAREGFTASRERRAPSWA